MESLCCCREKMIGPWVEAAHTSGHCWVLMPTGDPLVVTRYDVYPVQVVGDIAYGIVHGPHHNT